MEYDLCDLLSSNERDFLIRNNGDQVKINSLGNKIVGIYLCNSGSYEYSNYHRPKQFKTYVTPFLVNMYREIASLKGDDFEVVMVSIDREEEESFNAHFALMPWLAVPHAHSNAVLDNFRLKCNVSYFAIFDNSGKILLNNSFEDLYYYGAEAYPFTRQRILSLDEEDNLARKNQSLASFLGDNLMRCGPTREIVPVSQLVGKTVAIYLQKPRPYPHFNDLLALVYDQLKEIGEEGFEVVLVPDNDASQEEFQESIASMSWLTFPLRDKIGERIYPYFRRAADKNIICLCCTYDDSVPFVFVIGPDGKTVTERGSEYIRLYGADAFPFTREKIDLVDQEIKQGPWAMETRLAFHGQDSIFRKDGSKVPLSQLAGKPVMLLFGGSHTPPFKIMESCRGIKEKDDAFELICTGYSKKKIETALDDWMLVIPENDFRIDRLIYMFSNEWVTDGTAFFDSCGRLVTTKAHDLMIYYGEDAYPFTDDHLERLEKRATDIANEWPEKIKDPKIHRHHEIRRVMCKIYDCDACFRTRIRWNYKCIECPGFDLHKFYAFGGEHDGSKPDGLSLMKTIINRRK